VEWEERVALYVGGDVDGAAVAEIERHLAECAGCRAFAAELRESLELLRAAHAEEIPAACYTAVRARVMARLERPRRKRAWVYAAAAALLLAAGIGLRRPERQVGQVQDLPRPVAVSRQAIPAILPRAGQGPAPRRLRPKKKETILVKIETGNPDVVIYWIAETKGEE
jgi:anti-sigma factor RsiW